MDIFNIGIIWTQDQLIGKDTEFLQINKFHNFINHNILMHLLSVFKFNFML